MIAPVHQLGPTFGSQGWNDPLTWQTSSDHNEIGIGGAAGDDGDGEDSGRLLHPDWQTSPAHAMTKRVRPSLWICRLAGGELSKGDPAKAL